MSLSKLIILKFIALKHDLDPYIRLIKTHKTVCVVGSFFCMNPDFNEVIRKGKKIEGSNTAGTLVGNEFLKFCSDQTAGGKDVLPDIELITFHQLNGTRDRLVKSLCKYRHVINIERSMKSDQSYWVLGQGGKIWGKHDATGAGDKFY
jgi:D-arabinose 1-dehydrogenase-like Zn-dependent alcohol dehydrogenase